MNDQPVLTRIAILSLSLVIIPCVFSEVLVKNDTLDDVRIEKLDEGIEGLIEETAPFTLLAEGFEWSEGPVWMPDEDGYLLFTDVIANRVYRWDEKNGIQVWIQPSGYTGTEPNRARQGMMGANGLDIDLNGALLLCQHGDRRVARLSSENAFETVADRYKGKRFNSPNDLAVGSDGSIYFTDPPFGLRKKYSEKAYKLGFSGVFRIAPNGDVSLVTKEFERPNGIALSPDESTLYVGNRMGEDAKIWAFPISKKGEVGSSQLFFDASPLADPERRFVLDGMTVDEHGNLWATGPNGILIISPAGKHLGTIRLPHATANLCFGGPDGKQLFITSDSRLIRVNTLTRSATWSRR